MRSEIERKILSMRSDTLISILGKGLAEKVMSIGVKIGQGRNLGFIKRNTMDFDTPGQQSSSKVLLKKRAEEVEKSLPMMNFKTDDEIL